MKFNVNFKDPGIVSIELRRGASVIDKEDLTISQGFDTLFIRVLDNILSRNSIDRLSLKSMEIQGKMREGAISSMILLTIKNAFKI